LLEEYINNLGRNVLKEIINTKLIRIIIFLLFYYSLTIWINSKV